MPITNRAKYGFRYERALSALSPPSPEKMWIASAYANRIRIGDPVKLVAAGSIEIAAEGDSVYGVVTGGGEYHDGNTLIPAKFIPGGTTWTGHHNRSWVMVTPAAGAVFEIDVDDNVTATTEAGYAALVGNNADHNIPGSGDADATPTLDIDTAGTPTAGWRIIGVSTTADNEDFAGENVKLLVTINETQQAPYVVVGT